MFRAAYSSSEPGEPAPLSICLFVCFSLVSLLDLHSLRAVDVEDLLSCESGHDLPLSVDARQEPQSVRELSVGWHLAVKVREPGYKDLTFGNLMNEDVTLNEV